VEGVKAIIKTLGGEQGKLFCDVYSAFEEANHPENKDESNLESPWVRGLQLLQSGARFPSMPNIPLPVFGTGLLWDELANIDGWRVEENTLTHHCRVLNPDNVRIAWGGKDAIMSAFKQLQESRTIDDKH
jgi:hypothetical protein